MTSEEQEFLDRLNNPEKEIEQQEDNRKENRKLFLRNILNGAFMLLALAAMCGIGYSIYRHSDSLYNIFVGVGIVAVLIKMVEASMRMSGMLQKPKSMKSHSRKSLRS